MARNGTSSGRSSWATCTAKRRSSCPRVERRRLRARRVLRGLRRRMAFEHPGHARRDAGAALLGARAARRRARGRARGRQPRPAVPAARAGAGHAHGGTHTALFDEVALLLDELGVRAATAVGEALVTHAGVTRAWANDCLDLAEGTDAAALARQLNALLDHGEKISLRMLTQAGAGRGGRELPGPVWADRGELCADPLPGLDQIVGHTPVPTVEVRPSMPGTARRLPSGSPSATRSA